MSRMVSPKQREALELLDKGAEIHTVSHTGDLGWSAALWLENTRHKLSMATFEALNVQGWLENVGDPGYYWRGSTYVISAKGREQLEKERKEERTKAKIASLKRAGIRFKW